LLWRAPTMAKKTKRRTKRVSWTKSHLAELRKYSRDKLPVKKISRLMKRSIGALRQKARNLGIRIGHRRLPSRIYPRVLFPPKADTCSATRDVPLWANSGHGATYSITSSARPMSVLGMLSPSAFAVLRLMASWICVICCTGRSATFSPLRTRPTLTPT